MAGCVFISVWICLFINPGIHVGYVAERPEAVGGGVPVTDEERADILFKPQEDEWGGRSREEESARIIAGIDQLITVGMCTENRAELIFSS